MKSALQTNDPLTLLKRLQINNLNQKIFKDPYIIETSAGLPVDDLLKFYIVNNNGKLWYEKPEKCIATELIFSLLFFKCKLSSEELNFVLEKSKPYSKDITGLAQYYFKKLPQSGNIFDIGCHQGHYALAYSKYYSKVIAVDPFPQNYLTTKLNSLINKISNIEVFPYFVSDRSRDDGILSQEQQRYVEAEFLPVNYSNNSEYIISESICLDDLIKYNPDLIKIDTEGEELKILKGSQKILQTRPHLLIECHREINKALNFNEMRDLIDFNNYQTLGIPYRDCKLEIVEKDADLNNYKYLYMISKYR